MLHTDTHRSWCNLNGLSQEIVLVRQRRRDYTHGLSHVEPEIARARVGVTLPLPETQKILPLGIRVLLYDERVFVRAHVRALLGLEPDITIVGEAVHQGQMVNLVKRLRPDVALVGMSSEARDIIRLIGALAGPDVERPTSIIILSDPGHDHLVVEAVQAGAGGFVDKDSTLVIRAIRAVAAGEALLTPSATRQVLDYVKHPAAALPTWPAHAATLSRREREVLTLLAEGASNRQIARTLYVSESTVRSHVHHLLGKLDLPDRVQAVIFAYRHGLVRQECTSPGTIRCSVNQQ